MEEKEKELENLSDDDLEDLIGDEGDDDKKEKEAKEKEKEEMAERARQAKARREREAKEREAREKEIHDKALIEGELNASKVNTFTEKPIKDEYDLKIFKLQKEIEANGGDPIADLPEKLAELDRKQAKEVEEGKKAKKEHDDYIDKDIDDFCKAHPDVDLKKLLVDPDFKDYSDGRLGVKGGKSLNEIYENFEKFKAKYVKADVKEGNDGKLPTPSTGGGKPKTNSYSKMTHEEKIAKLKKDGLIR